MMSGDLIKTLSGSLKKKDIDILSLGDPNVGAIVKHRIPTSSILLNRALGGGIPCGRLTEIFGEESNGKSSLVADIMAQTQKLGGVAFIIDSEQVFNPERASAMGLDVDQVGYSDVVTVEGAFDVMDAIADQIDGLDQYITIVWDSVAASPTKDELEGGIEQQAMAAKARILSKGLRRYLGKIGPKTTLIFINQVRSKMGISFGKPTEASGGYAIRYFASVRLELSKLGMVKDSDGKAIGIKCKAFTSKNKTNAPFKSAEYEMYFDGGISDSNALLDILIKSEKITQGGSWYNYGKKKFQRKDFNKFLEELGPEKSELLLEEALSKL